MNTPSHTIVNLAFLGKDRPRGAGWAIAAGSLVPDVPMVLWFLWEKLVLGHATEFIFETRYFLPGPQRLFDAFNSIPLALLGAVVAHRLGRTRTTLFFASVVLHCLLDLPLHHDDGHGHFFPFTAWKFASPVSYWDPAHFGMWGALGEWALVVGCAALLWRRTESRWRWAAAGYAAVFGAGWVLGFLV